LLNVSVKNFNKNEQKWDQLDNSNSINFVLIYDLSKKPSQKIKKMNTYMPHAIEINDGVIDIASNNFDYYYKDENLHPTEKKVKSVKPDEQKILI
jgi:hypothetical protein